MKRFLYFFYFFIINIYSSNLEEIEKFFKSKISDSISKIAENFLETPYKKNNNLNDSFSTNLYESQEGLDCVSFVEMCIALNLVKNNFSIYNLENIIKKIKFKNIDNLNSQTNIFHYSFDFLLNNSVGLENITNKIFSDSINLIAEKKKKINFMSKNSNLYDFLKNNEENLLKIKEIENKLNNSPFWAIEKKLLIEEKNISLINDSSIIYFSPDNKSLDFSHCGIIKKEENNLFLIHASSEFNKIIKVPLLDYLNNKNFKYIVISKLE